MLVTSLFWVKTYFISLLNSEYSEYSELHLSSILDALCNKGDFLKLCIYIEL